MPPIRTDDRDDADKGGLGGLLSSAAGHLSGDGARDPYASESVPGFENDNIRYLDARPLTRPIEMPHGVTRGALALFAVALAIGAAFLWWYINATIYASSIEAHDVQLAVEREVALDLPQISALMGLSDEEIMAALQQTDETLYEKTPVGSLASGGLEVVKLPPDVSLEEAAAIYLTGIDNARPASVAQLLNGSWQLRVTRNTTNSDIYVSYADFRSNSEQAAIEAAMEAEGIPADSVAASGVDDMGNTYSTGSVDTDGGQCTWRVSVVSLSSVYSLSGLPESALYVGIRYTTI